MTLFVLLRALLAAALIALPACAKKDDASGAAVGARAGRPAKSATAADPLLVNDIEPGKPGGSIVVGAVAGPSSFNPFVANDAASIEIVTRVFDGLVEIDCATGEFRPALASRWEVSPDGLRWTFALRRGVVWADGTPFTADDVLWNFAVLYDDSVEATSRENFSLDGEPFTVTKEVGVWREGDEGREEKIVIETPRPYGPLLNALATSLFLVPKHRWEAAHREGRLEEALGVDTPPAEVFGTGPFRLDTIEPDRVVLARNPNYWKRDAAGTQLPYADRMVFVKVGDWNGWRLKFDAKEVDQYIAKPDEIAMLTSGRAASAGTPGAYTLHDLGPRTGTNMFWLNQSPGSDEKGVPYVDPVKRAWFRDLRFRQAIVHAIDREAIVRTLFNGYGTVIDGPLSPADRFWFNKNLPRYAHDPARARALLAEMGHRDANGDGTLEDAAGRKVAFTFLTNAENPVRIAMGRLIEDDLRAVGIAATLDVREFGALIATVFETMRYDACLLAATGGGDPAGGLSSWLSSGEAHQFDPMQPEPRTDWERAVDSVATLSVETIDFAERKRLFDRVQELYAINLGWIFLANDNTVLAVRDRFGNVRPGTLRAFNEFCWNEDELFVRE